MHPGWGDGFKARREPFYLYLHAGSRIKCQHEQHSEGGFGWDRQDAQADALIDGADIDAAELAADITARFCDYLSIHQLRFIIPALQQLHDKWEAERLIAVERYKRVYESGEE